MSSRSAINYCVNLVKRTDRDAYLTTLLHPKKAQSAIFVLRAFNAEVVQTFQAGRDRELTNNRLDFWQRAVDSIYRSKGKPLTEISAASSGDAALGIPPSTPVCAALSTCARQYNLPSYWLKRIVSARRTAGDSFQGLDDMLKYAEDTQSVLLQLSLAVLGVKNVEADKAACFIGKGVTLANFLRSTPAYVLKGLTPQIPKTVLEKHGVIMDQLLRGRTTESIQAAVFELALTAHNQLLEAEKLRNQVPKTARVMFLSTFSANRYLARLQKAYFDPFDKSVNILPDADYLLPYHLYLHHCRNKLKR